MSNLIVKSFLGLVFLLVFLGFLLFVSAGSLNFWQAWLYLAVFGISTIFVTLYLVKYDQKLLESRVTAGPAAESEKTQKVIQSLASLLFMMVFIVAGLDYRFHWSVVPSVISLIADVFVVLGFYIVFLTFKANSYTSAVIEVKQDQQVITSRPYVIVRHPMYMGASLLLIFTPLALGSWVAFPFPFHLNGYSDYRQRVRYRIIPFVW